MLESVVPVVLSHAVFCGEQVAKQSPETVVMCCKRLVALGLQAHQIINGLIPEQRVQPDM